MSSPPRTYDYLFKILLVGDSQVGKTKILWKFAGDAGAPLAKASTIGIDFLIKNIVIKGKRIRLQIWDTAGQERFRTITTAYYRGATGVILVYDITEQQSFDNLRSWLANIREHAPADVVITLVGNKCHKQNHRKIPVHHGEQFAEENDMRFKEVSCEMDINIEDVFYDLAEDILNRVDSYPNLLQEEKNTIRPRGDEERDRNNCGC